MNRSLTAVKLLHAERATSPPADIHCKKEPVILQTSVTLTDSQYLYITDCFKADLVIKKENNDQ